MKKNHPHHQLFELTRAGTVDLKRCIPVFVHVDEGRTYKSKGLLILSVHGALGKGTRAYVRRFAGKTARMKENPMPMNYLGSTWASQFMIFSLLRTSMQSNPRALETLLGIFARDMEKLSKVGVTGPNGRKRYWVQLLNCKADLPALQKVGGLKRNYLRAPKKQVSREPCVGMCWLCRAGQEEPEAIPFEEYTTDAKWIATCNVEDPWDARPAIMSGIPVDPTAEATFFATDLWHNWHNGLCKTFVANSFFSFITTPNLIPAASFEAKFQWLTADYNNFCERKGLTPYLREITRDTISFDSANSVPQGMWNKGEVSTHLMLYLEDFCARFVQDTDAARSDYILRTIVARPTYQDFISFLLVGMLRSVSSVLNLVEVHGLREWNLRHAPPAS